VEDWVKEYWLKALFGAFVSCFGALILWVKKKFKRQEAIELGLQALLRNEIKKAYTLCAEKEYCTMEDMDNIQNMYDRYHLLGGNGSVTRLLEKLKELPTERES